MPQEAFDNQSSDNLRVNFFKPRPGFMRREVSVISITLFAWAIVAIGYPLCLGLTTTDPSVLVATGPSIFGMPLHYWFGGHFVILWFILICFTFNVLIDWLTKSYRRRP